jgi:hypothetical protein
MTDVHLVWNNFVPMGSPGFELSELLFITFDEDKARDFLDRRCKELGGRMHESGAQFSVGNRGLENDYYYLDTRRVE